MRTGQVTGESLRIAVVKRGENPHQGVGFLEDGTMVVVEGGKGRSGERIAVTVTGVELGADAPPIQGASKLRTAAATPNPKITRNKKRNKT